MPRSLLLPLLALAALLSLTLACGEDDPAGPDTTDTTRPTVVSVDPHDGETDVSTDETVRVIFSEPMDLTSHAGQVALSGGTLGALSWFDERTLLIGHAEFAEGVQVGVTLGTGLADAAGNTLAAPVAFSFWTESSTFSVLWVDPAEGAVDVLLNRSITVQFSQQPHMASLASHITLADVPLKTDVDFTVSQSGENQVRIDPAADLAASTTYRLTLDAGTQADAGGTLGAAVTVEFTTGTQSDETPPQLVSLEPADGSVIAADQGFLRMTFDEPVDPEYFEPSAMAAQLQLAMRDGQPAWSEGGTVLTVPLHTPLPAGVIYEVVFDEFRDLSGNVNADGFEWTVTVAGTPDHFPVLDDLIFYYDGWYLEGPLARHGKSSYSYAHIFDWESGSSELFRRTEIHEGDETAGNWDYLRKSSAGVKLRGFHESWTDSKAEIDVWINPEVDYMRHPMTPQTWSGTGSITPEGGASLSLSYEVRILAGTQDVPIGWGKFGGIRGNGKDVALTYWNECRMAILTHEIRDGVLTTETGVDTLVLAPGLGLVEEWSSYEDYEEGLREWSRSTLTDLGLREEIGR